jgi:protein-tyrosine phosphatase
MIDLHCHILPGIDDGSSDIGVSVQMAKDAKQAGFDTLFCSSHYMVPNYISPKDNNKKLIDSLKERLIEENIDLSVKLANEIYINESIISLLKENQASNFEGTNYVLIELPLNQEIKYAEEIIEDVIDAGYRVILAHPERYAFIKKDPNKVIPFIEMGVILQSNYASIIGKYGDDAKKTVEKLLRARMINCLATDCHRPHSIYTRMGTIKNELRKYIDKDYFENITETNPRKILNNEEIDRYNYSEIKTSFFIFFKK